MGLYDEYGTCLSIDLFGGIPYVISGIRFQSLSIYLYMYEYTWFGRRTNVHGFMDSCGMDSLTFCGDGSWIQWKSVSGNQFTEPFASSVKWCSESIIE